MNIKLIVEDWLKSHGYDGLCNPEIPCGCLSGDLAPCGELHEDCQPGHREDVGESCDCGCDGQGTEHWHITIQQEPFLSNDDAFAKHLADAKDWLCECRQRCQPMAADWRWNGRDWEHHHGYPIGHVAATRSPNNSITGGE
jgi:hypothetical protein